MIPRHDVFIVGAGPAGLATAIASAVLGLRVAVADARVPPIDKPCGEGMLPQTVERLRALGITLDSSVAFPFEGIRFADESSSARAMMCGKAFGMRRTALHALLLDRAARAGVQFFWGARISDINPRGLRVNGRALAARWIVGADGRNSIVRRSAGMGRLYRDRCRFAFLRHYAVRPWTSDVEVYWGERCQMVITPTGREEICVAVFSRDSNNRIGRALGLFPEVAERLRSAHPVSAEAGAVTSLGCARAVTRGNIALVGDASCVIDGIAGHGLSLALGAAPRLADALERQDLWRYESAHGELTRIPLRMTRLLLLLDAHTWLRRKVLRLFASTQAIFAKVMAVHTGETETDPLEPREILGFGWRLLAA